MNEYIIWWTPAQQSTLISMYPFLNVDQAVYNTPTTEWPNGWFHLYQYLNNNQFNQLDGAADNHLCINIKPATRPPYSPTGR